MGRKKKRMRLLARQAAATAPAPVAKEVTIAPPPVAKEVAPAPKKSAPAPARRAVERKAPLRSAAKKTTKKS